MRKTETDQQQHKEKPLSLYPLTMGEALREVLQVKPPPKDGAKQPAKTTKPKSS